MSPPHDPLWQRIAAHEIGPPGAALTFTARLARENRWSADYAARVTVEYLMFFLFITACVALARWSGTDKRTKAGLEARDDALDAFTRLSQGHTSDETGLAVALFGTSILATSDLGDFHRMRTNNGSDGGGSSGGDGDGGGGGGGCGGCGS